MSWKYIMVQVDDRALPVIFPGQLVHAEVWQRLRYPFYEMAKMKDPAVVSAGFLEGMAVAVATGESETLRIKARDEDTQLINNHPYEHGMPSPLGNSSEVLILKKTIDLLTLRMRELGG